MRITESKIRQIIREELTRHLSEGWEGGGSMEWGRHGPEGIRAETDDTYKAYRAMADHDRRKRELEEKERTERVIRDMMLDMLAKHEKYLGVEPGTIMKAFPNEDVAKLVKIGSEMVKEKAAKGGTPTHMSLSAMESELARMAADTHAKESKSEIESAIADIERDLSMTDEERRQKLRNEIEDIARLPREETSSERKLVARKPSWLK